MSKKSHAKLIWTGLVLGLLIVAISLALRFGTEIGEPLPPNFEDFSESETGNPTTDVTDPTAAENPLLNAIASGEVANCEKLTDPTTATECTAELWHAQALEQQDPALCTKITAPQRSASCEAEVFFSLALSAKDPKLCAKIQTRPERMNCEAVLNSMVQ
jgi:hypothetical protein